MLMLVLGESGLAGILSDHLRSAGVDSRQWGMPHEARGVAAVRLLASFPPPDSSGVVFTSVRASYVGAVAAGWRLVWCGEGEAPDGVEPMPGMWAGLSVAEMVERLWHVRVVDRRLVADVLAGVTRSVGVVVFVSSATGGVGKSVSSRRLCELAASKGVRALLVDGNQSQDSQRSFFDPAHRLPVRGVADWVEGGVSDCVVGGKTLKVGYDVAFAPARLVKVDWGVYERFVRAARREYELVVVDLDRMGAPDLGDSGSAAGGLVVPGLLRGDCLLFVVRAGVATARDAMNVLVGLKSCDVDSGLVGVKECCPVGLDDYPKVKWGRLGCFLGVESWSMRAAGCLARGESGWSDAGLDSVRLRVFSWLFPERKVKEPVGEKPVRKSWWGRLFRRG